MIRILITGEAYEAIASSMPGLALRAPQRLADGHYAIWLPKAARNRLQALRGPGEDWSAVILRIAR